MALISRLALLSLIPIILLILQHALKLSWILVLISYMHYTTSSLNSIRGTGTLRQTRGFYCLKI